MNHKKWSDEEWDILRKYYGTISSKQIHELYLPNRTIGTIQKYGPMVSVNPNNKSMRTKWTDEDEKILKDNYNLVDNNELHNKYLPNFSVASIKSKAYKLGLVREYQTWSTQEIKFLTENYNRMRIRELAKYLNHSENSIRKKANNMGLKNSHRWTQEDDDIIIKNLEKISAHTIRDLYFKDITLNSIRSHIQKIKKDGKL